MNVVALVSGGKDSCYSILQCQKHGHKVIALANLLPADSSVDELDSYMYQTVGHQLVCAYAACTGLPLFRRRIQGHSRSQGLSYDTTAGDEVEDLLLLLAYVKEAHPEVQAVASGAIASDYQRLRVESVCSRLGLVSLAYLWHQPQQQLLQDMVDNGIEAVLVKVAALGLDPHKHLGNTIQQVQPHLLRLRDRFGCNVCGEGGEYETLTLDCPAFTHGRIVLDGWQVMLHSPDSIAAVGVLHPTAFHVEPKQQGALAGAAATDSSQDTSSNDGSASSSGSVVEVPLDGQPQQQAASGAVSTTSNSSSTTTSSSSSRAHPWTTHVTVTSSDHHLHIMCSAHTPIPAAAAGAAATTATATDPSTPSSPLAADTAAAVDAALSAVAAQLLVRQGVSGWQGACFVHLYLADMAHFAAANAAYCRHLPKVNPPSRACVQVPLPPGCPVLLDVLCARQRPPQGANCSDGTTAGTKGDKQQQVQQQEHKKQQQQQQPDRRVLHVQSISDWAPSCIGPYSQATSCNGIIHMAGQIPLDPGSMSMVMQPPNTPSGSSGGGSSGSSGSSGSAELVWRVAAQVWRALCSCQAVAIAVKSCFASSSLGLTVYVTPEADAAGARALLAAALGAVWRDRSLLQWPDMMPAALVAAASAAAGSGGGDDGDIAATATAAGAGGHAGNEVESEGSGSEGEGPEELFLDDYLRPPEVQQPLQPAVVCLTVPALPRGALLEVQPLLLDLQAVAAAAAAAGSSSSSDADDPCTAASGPQQGQRSVAATAEAATAGGGGDGLDLLQQHGVAVGVTAAENSTWRRVLLQLQTGDSCSAESCGRDRKCAQAAAVVTWIAAHSPQLVSLRCWYKSDMYAGFVQGDSWAQALLAQMPSDVAGQMVPVLSAGTLLDSQGSRCWCVIELIGE